MQIKSYLSLVKFSHTIFALPFALIGFFVSLQRYGNGAINPRLLLLVLACMVTARNAAMAFNRWADQKYDALNPRTATREIPSGVISSRAGMIFIIVNSVLFICFAALINPLCFALSPVALLVVFGYSLTKRFSWLCHLFLGLGLSLAPVGAYLAVSSHFDYLPVLYGLAVICWVAGFDILYALQDIEFDQSQSLFSIPARFGIHHARMISGVLHAICAILIISCSLILIREFHLDYWIEAGTLFFLGLLIYQHWVVHKYGTSHINLAFFTTNGVASILLAVGTILDFYF